MRAVIFIEEFQDYLVRKGWAEDLAAEIADAAYRGGRKGILTKMHYLDDERHDWSGEAADHYHAWQLEVGEI